MKLGLLIVLLSWLITKCLDVGDLKSFDPYEILSVSNNSSLSEIRKNYLKLARIHHPDKNPNDPES